MLDCTHRAMCGSKVYDENLHSLWSLPCKHELHLFLRAEYPIFRISMGANVNSVIRVGGSTCTVLVDMANFAERTPYSNHCIATERIEIVYHKFSFATSVLRMARIPSERIEPTMDASAIQVSGSRQGKGVSHSPP